MSQTHQKNTGTPHNHAVMTAPASFAKKDTGGSRLVPDAHVGNWLILFSCIVAFLIVFGGFVRLTRSGLSITEWNPVSGTLPPLSQAAWQVEFAKYQQTPEYLQINSGMTLAEYKYIFYIEWIHRLIARLAGLAYAIPVFYFLFTRRIRLRGFGIYFVMGSLFIAQAVAGWIMVASGLVDRPSVSHFNLTIHLLLALTLLGLALWTALGHRFGFPDPTKKASWSAPSKLAVTFLMLLLIQIAYGGFTAGLKAGHVSDTWPLMFGKLIPPNLFNSFISILESPITIVFIHRWFAFVVLVAVIYVYYMVRKNHYQPDLLRGLGWLVGAVSLQVILGILTVLFYVNIVVALLHQAGAVALFALTIYFIHRFRALDRA
jgi:cytochrome c oxidase assembly protein subunit 15